MSRIPVEPVSDGLFLAAVERAQRHGKGGGSVLWQDVVAHLGFETGAWTTRRLAPQRDALLQEGLLLNERLHGLTLWGLTSRGREQLWRARQMGEVGALAESPQHRRWLNAHEAASGRIEDLREQVRVALEEASGFLSDREAHSDLWFEIGERLGRSCWQLGSATYCLREWPEPDDAHLDLDDDRDPGDEDLDPAELRKRRRRRSGRRTIYKWKTKPES